MRPTSCGCGCSGRPKPAPNARRSAQGIDLATALKQLKQVDHARDQYVRRLYRISVDDPEVFHLQIDSTAIPLEGCVDVIVTAYRALIG